MNEDEIRTQHLLTPGSRIRITFHRRNQSNEPHVVLSMSKDGLSFEGSALKHSFVLPQMIGGTVITIVQKPNVVEFFEGDTQLCRCAPFESETKETIVIDVPPETVRRWLFEYLINRIEERKLIEPSELNEYPNPNRAVVCSLDPTTTPTTF